MKLNLKTVKRINIKLPDQFERDAIRRQRALDDWGIVEQIDEQPMDSNPNDEPNDLRAMLNMSVDPDYSDERTGDVFAMLPWETLCTTTNLRVPKNSECPCGQRH